MHAMNIAKLDLNLLVVFDALMAERNVTRAARRVFLSQPAVSHALARLRVALDDPLFVRNGRDMTPTPRAESLAIVVRPLLEGLAGDLEGPAFSPGKVDQVFRLGMPDIVELVLMPRLLPLLAKEAPDARLAVQDLELETFQARLAAGELDAAITPDVPLRPGMHRRSTAVEERVVGLVRKGHPATRGKVTPQSLREIPRLAATLSGGRVASPIEATPLARKLGRLQFSTPHFAAAAESLLHSEMVFVIGALAGETLAARFDLAVLELPFKLPPVESSLVWHERGHRDPAQRWLRETIIRALAPAAERHPSRIPHGLARRERATRFRAPELS
jgi:DNA-binding transcriptional LysR family regulator